MGAMCSGDHEMNGEWSVLEVMGEGAKYPGGESNYHLFVHDGSEEHFEGDATGVIKAFKASKGKWSGKVIFDDFDGMGTSDYFTLTGTYTEDSATCELKPGPKNNSKGCSTWTLEKLEAYEH
eukprot:gnl/MRDRNA2_/MRDRNA2_89063_c0_seq1.p1 gnl/MRDRNA2_/MRDRNA2_89063_c0~~gnl/MRDRNA2_/MRDRNA2_89063_c0_seq1.p1  ORF type:complete len:122 (+),score=28.86 gnl/MRDRNA2_/MRDRNA2_89063_c0_seq1:94-459(+)